MLKALSLEDLDAVRGLFLEVFTAPPWEDRWPDDETVNRYLLELMDNKNSLSFGYFLEEELIGLCLGYTFSWWQGREYFVKEFCIRGQVQGKGHGQAFMKAMEKDLVERNLTALWLLTDQSTPAYSFYKNLTFQEDPKSTFFYKNLKPQ